MEPLIILSMVILTTVFWLSCNSNVSKKEKIEHMGNVIFITFLLLPVAVMADTANAKESSFCDQQWHKIAASKGEREYSKLLEAWLAMESKCKGSGIYEFRLSNIYDRLGNRTSAKDITVKGLAIDNEYLYLNQMNKWLYAYYDLLESGSSDVSKYIEIEAQLLNIATDHKDWSPIYEQLSNVQVFMGKNDDAISNASRALEIDSKSWLALRALVIAYADKGQHERGRPLIMKAAEMNESLLADPEFMIMSAFTYVSVGELETAKNVLGALYEREPEVKKDERFIKLFKHLRENIKK